MRNSSTKENPRRVGPATSGSSYCASAPLSTSETTAGPEEVRNRASASNFQATGPRCARRCGSAASGAGPYAGRRPPPRTPGAAPSRPPPSGRRAAEARPGPSDCSPCRRRRGSRRDPPSPPSPGSTKTPPRPARSGSGGAEPASTASAGVLAGSAGPSPPGEEGPGTGPFAGIQRSQATTQTSLAEGSPGSATHARGAHRARPPGIRELAVLHAVRGQHMQMRVEASAGTIPADCRSRSTTRSTPCTGRP